MKLKVVRYGRSVSKDYQSRRVEVELEVEAGESYDDVLAEAKKMVVFGLSQQDPNAPRRYENTDVGGGG